MGVVLPRALALVAALVLFAAAAPATPDRTFTVTADGAYPAIAADRRGGFMVAWIGTTSRQVFARRFAADAVPLTGAIAAGAYAYEATTVSLAAMGGDRCWLAWDSWPHYGTPEAFARLLRPRSPAGGRLVPLGGFSLPSIAALGPDGDWVAALAGAVATAEGAVPGIRLQLRAASGAWRGSLPVAPGFGPRVAGDAAGNVSVVWMAGDGLRLRGYAPGGVFASERRLTPERVPFALAANAGGRAVIAWAGRDGIAARLLRPAATPVGETLRVADVPTDRLDGLAAGIDARGRTLIVWGTCCGESQRIAGRRFERDGSAAGEEFLLADRPALFPAAAASDDAFIVIWTEGTQIRGRTLRWPHSGADATP